MTERCQTPVIKCGWGFVDCGANCTWCSTTGCTVCDNAFGLNTTSLSCLSSDAPAQFEVHTQLDCMECEDGFFDSTQVCAMRVRAPWITVKCAGRATVEAL